MSLTKESSPAANVNEATEAIASKPEQAFSGILVRWCQRRVMDTVYLTSDTLLDW